ncbi:hypothetical protein GCM10011374_23060 [Kocuria dechangensis]|uniref:Uncharacterized protein n=1 Tax=Kocuria dechangensis TaxID=1176249 RepID=A0A917GX55_9MICC|nr:hypothetical protein GCM10011374_23060 [Kocuria dechangensis]
MQLEGLAQDVEHVQLDQTLLRKPFGETGQGGLAGHGDVLLGWDGGRATGCGDGGAAVRCGGRGVRVRPSS